MASKELTDLRDCYMQTLYCRNKECLARTRIGRILQLPVTRIGPMAFCPLCGGEAYPETDNNETYNETLAAAYGLPVEVIVLLLNNWDRQEFTKFSDYVKDMLEAVAKETAVNVA